MSGTSSMRGAKSNHGLKLEYLYRRTVSRLDLVLASELDADPVMVGLLEMSISMRQLYCMCYMFIIHVFNAEKCSPPSKLMDLLHVIFNCVLHIPIISCSPTLPSRVLQYLLLLLLPRVILHSA